MVEGTSSESVTWSATRPRLLWHTILPIGAGIVSAVLIGSDGGIPSVLMVCAAIYLFSAVIGRPAATWWVFAGVAVPVIGLSAVYEREWLSLLVLGAAQVVVFVVGLILGRWTQRHNLFQLMAAAGFGVLAVAAAAAGAPTVASVIVIVGLIAHTIWDLVYHRKGIVVSRSYAAFCAGLDVALAVAVAGALVAGT